MPLDVIRRGHADDFIHGYILEDARRTQDEWGGCKGLNTVLGKDGCAKKYFSKQWGQDGNEYVDDESGKDNMKRSSDMIVRGDKKMTKNKKPTWQ